MRHFPPRSADRKIRSAKVRSCLAPIEFGRLLFLLLCDRNAKNYPWHLGRRSQGVKEEERRSTEYNIYCAGNKEEGVNRRARGFLWLLDRRSHIATPLSISLLVFISSPRFWRSLPSLAPVIPMSVKYRCCDRHLNPRFPSKFLPIKTSIAR